MEMEDPRIAPTSMSASSMIDALAKSKREIMSKTPDNTIERFEYNSLYITADELSAFMHKYDEEAIGTMSAFYDPNPYGQTRRGNDINIKIKSPQLNLIAGTTPSNLMKYMPESAWEQGFTSRVIMVFSDERSISDDFARSDTTLDPDLIHDLKHINSLVGPMFVKPEYREAVILWRQQEEPPKPNHPKLIHYNTRRRVHLYKLSMIAAIDRSDTLMVGLPEFQQALEWLIEVEALMPDIFKAGAGNADAKAQDEIYHYVLMQQIKWKHGVPEYLITRFARNLVPLHSIDRVIKAMVNSKLLFPTFYDKKLKQSLFKATLPEMAPEDPPNPILDA